MSFCGFPEPFMSSVSFLGAAKRSEFKSSTIGLTGTTIFLFGLPGPLCVFILRCFLLIVMEFLV